MGDHQQARPGAVDTDPEGSAGISRVRRYILTAVHVGRLSPGDRIPSVRRLSRIVGLNPKTVHRAYRVLADEGVLEARSGCGTFVAEGRTPVLRHDASAGKLVQAVNRCRSEAASLGLSPKVFAAYLSNYLGDGLQDLPLAVAECNQEQIDAVSRHLGSALGANCSPVLLRDLAAAPGPALEGRWGVVTTDCHRAEVEASVASTGKPVYRVALDEKFPRRLAERARSAPGWMVVADPRFASVFRRLLLHLSVTPDVVSRVEIVSADEARTAFRETNGHRWVWVSPLVERKVAPILPPEARRVRGLWPIASKSFERLRARLALDVALQTLRE